MQELESQRQSCPNPQELDSARSEADRRRPLDRIVVLAMGAHTILVPLASFQLLSVDVRFFLLSYRQPLIIGVCLVFGLMRFYR